MRKRRKPEVSFTFRSRLGYVTYGSTPEEARDRAGVAAGMVFDALMKQGGVERVKSYLVWQATKEQHD